MEIIHNIHNHITMIKHKLLRLGSAPIWEQNVHIQTNPMYYLAIWFALKISKVTSQIERSQIF